MRQQLKPVHIFLHGLGLLLAVCLALLALLIWRIESGGLSVNVMRPVLTAEIERRLPEGSQVSIERVHLRRSPDGSDYVLEMGPVSLNNNARGLSASVPVVNAKLGKDQLFNIQPHDLRIHIADPVVDLDLKNLTNQERRANPHNTDETSAGASLRNQLFGAKLPQLTVTNLTVRADQAGDGAQWEIRNGDIILAGDDSLSHALTANGDLISAQQGEAAPISVSATPDDAAKTMKLEFKGNDVPVGALLAVIAEEGAPLLQAPVSGEAFVIIDQDMEPINGAFDVSVGVGTLHAGERVIAIQKIELNGGVDPGDGTIDLEQLVFEAGQSKGKLSGTFHQQTDQNGASAISFDLSGDTLALDTFGLFPEILSINKLAVRGDYQADIRRLKLPAIMLDLGDATIAGDLQFDRPQGVDGQNPPSFGLVANLKANGPVSSERVIELWPLKLAPNSRNWVQTRVSAGMTDNIDFRMNLPVGLRDEVGFIPDEALLLDFDVSDVSVEFILGLTKLSRANGHGLLRGNSLLVDLTSGKLNTINVSEGQLEFPAFNPRGGKQIYRFKGDGPAGEMLSILDEKPLRLMTRSGILPEKITGAASIDVVMVRPAVGKRPRGGFEYDGKAKFSGLSFVEIFQDLDLSDGEGTIDLKTRGLTIEGNGQLAASPVTMRWEQNFYEEDGPSNLSVSGLFDAAAGDAIGIPTRNYLRGDVPYILHESGGYQALQGFDLEADFSAASLNFAPAGFFKPANSEAKLRVSAKLKDELLTMDVLSLEGEGLTINGTMAFEQSGRLDSMHFPTFFIQNQADFAIEAARMPNGAMDLSVSGQFLDLGPAIANTLERSSAGIPQDVEPTDDASDGGEFDWGAGVRATFRLDEMRLRNGIVLRDPTLDFWHDSERMDVLDIAGLDNDLDMMRLSLSHSAKADGVSRIIEAETTDLGSLFEGIFSITSFVGGEGKLSIDLGTQETPVFEGNAFATNLKVKDAPLMAKLFAAGSFDGLNNLLTNEGIALDQATSNFAIDDGRITLTDTRAIGSAVGITVDGSVRLDGKGDVALRGALAPAYQVNSFLGRTPLIGGLLVNRKGEGLLAITYDIEGTVSDPEITINPLMALAPGVLRRAFENENAPGGTGAPVPVPGEPLPFLAVPSEEPANPSP